MSEEIEHFDWSHHYELIERALTLWREGEQALWRQPWAIPSVAQAHERAIRVGVEYLRRFETMGELVAAYYAPTLPSAGEEPGGRQNESWIECACRVANAWPANRRLVEDASYFRRSREMVLEAVAKAENS